MTDHDAAHVMNVIAEAVQDALGEGSRPSRPFLPLSVRYGAAEAAVRVVMAWKEKGVAPPMPRFGQQECPGCSIDGSNAMGLQGHLETCIYNPMRIEAEGD